MGSPLVSVICTNYNKSKWIEQTIRSLLSQKTNFNFEILVIDDASTDDSPGIIQKIYEENLDKIRFFKNEENLGIAKTWKKICNEARGKYIARCDGDDYWISEEKLQKQVDLLEKSKDSKWCNTEFQTENEKGEILFKKSFAEKFVKMPEDFTEMLISKGFTNASTWLIETELMKEVNNTLDITTPDDTFDIQLELFIRTKLSTVKDPMVSYRFTTGSDSHPEDLSKIQERNQRLLKTQINFLQKYQDKVNFLQATKELLEKQTTLENYLAEKEISILERNKLLNDRQKFIDEQGLIIKHHEDSVRDLENNIEELENQKWFGLHKIIYKDSKKEKK